MADNNKVTIDAALFAELYAKWKGAKSGERPCEGCTIVGDLDDMRAECGNLRKKRDELMKQKEAAERCIEDCCGHIACGTAETIPASLGAIEDIIRSYRERKETK